MTKADEGSTQPTSEVQDSEKMTTVALKKRIHRVTFIVTTILACFVCFLSADKYFSWIAQTVIARTDVHISEIPFPAVTLCPLMNVYYLKKDLPKEDELTILGFLHSLEESVPSDDDRTDFNDQGLTALGYIDAGDILNKLSIQCEDFFEKCTWRRINRNCCSLFHKIKYGRKTCYSFNSLTVEDPEATWPWSETLSGRKSGLKVIMKTNASKAMIPKVMAMIHYPEEQFSTNRLYLQGKVHISLDALKFYADPSIRQLYPKYRRCYFTDEVIKLRKSHTKCWNDCRAAYMERVCNCTPRPSLLSSNLDQKYCNITHLPCVYKHRAIFLSSGNIYEKNVNEDSTEFMDCKCFPNCNYIQYKTFIHYDMETSKIEGNSRVELEVFFLRDTIFSYRTAMAYSFLDFIVAICSIIALFLGISFISVIKAIQDYFEKRKKARTLALAAKQNR